MRQRSTTTRTTAPTRAPTTSSASEETVKRAAATTTEDVTKLGEDIVHGHTASAKTATSNTTHSGMTELIVSLFFLRVT